MSSAAITALATGLLVLVGIAQSSILVAQRRQHRLDVAEKYRARWRDSRMAWGVLVFFGRDLGEYYQVVDSTELEGLEAATKRFSLSAPTVWALDCVQTVGALLSDVCMRVLQGQLRVSDVYPVFGTELLRHSRALRTLLDPDYQTGFIRQDLDPELANAHQRVRAELQVWLGYHPGMLRRCLILIDLLWAEAARLEDLPPEDLERAATAKLRTGRENRARVVRECLRLNGLPGAFLARRLARFLRHAEYKRGRGYIGIDKSTLKRRRFEWTARLLRLG